MSPQGHKKAEPEERRIKDKWHLISPLRRGQDQGYTRRLCMRKGEGHVQKIGSDVES